MRYTKLSAWDHVQDNIVHVTRAGGQCEHTANEERLADALNKLCQMQLPIEAIHQIGQLVEASYDIAQERHRAAAGDKNLVA